MKFWLQSGNISYNYQENDIMTEQLHGAEQPKRGEVSLIYYRKKLEERLSKIQGEAAKVKALVEALDDAQSDRSLILRFYETPEGDLSMETIEKKPVGFELPGKPSGVK